MGMMKLGCKNPDKRYWIELPSTYKAPLYNNFLVVNINDRLWQKVQNIWKIQKKGFDAHICIAGDRRTGKSTKAKIIAYLSNPRMNIKNFVKGMDDAVEAIDRSKERDVLIFDEATLTFNSKDAIRKGQSQLLKIIDVVGQKRLLCIYCLPDYFTLNRTIAVKHSLFILYTYLDNQMNRGFFAYFGKNKLSRLYSIGKKHYGTMSGAKADFTGRFYKFELPFEDEYLELKKQSLKEALGIKSKILSREEKNSFIEECLRNYYVNLDKLKGKITLKSMGMVFGVSDEKIRLMGLKIGENPKNKKQDIV